MFRRAVCTPLIALALFLPSMTSANVDSFFDIFTEVDAQNLLCDICDSIQADIDAKQLLIDSINDDIDIAERDLALLDAEIDLYDEGIEQAEKALDTLRNPKDYVESEGRHYDSADHAAMQRRSANLWNAYKAGKLSAQEYSDEVAKDFDDPDVARELEKIKKDLEKEISDSIKAMKKNKKEAEQDRKDINAKAAALTQELSECLTELEKLIDAHARCLLQCKVGELKVDEFGVTPEERSLVDSFFDVFTGLIQGPPRILPDPELKPDLPQIPIELVDLDLKSLEPIEVVLPDSFFDVFTGLSDPVVLPVPKPRCQMCDPIAKEIADKEAELEAKKALLEMAEDIVEPFNQLKKDGEKMLEEAKKNLDRLQNPTDYAESEGSRYDGADHAAMQVRNQRLWAAYRAGILGASDLEAEWAKDLDDPDVQDDLEDIKEELEEELEDAIDDIEEQLEELDEKMKEFNKELANLKKEIAECESKLAVMRDALRECEKLCKETRDAVSFIDDLLKDDFTLWGPPPGGFDIPTSKEDTVEDDVDDKVTCMTTRECEETCVPQGKACAAVERDGKTCQVCTDENECVPGTKNFKECEENCDGSCSRDFKAGPACFSCDSCLKPTMTSRACEESCVVDGGACEDNPEGGESCFDCTMDNPCKAPAMNFAECDSKCDGGCTRDDKAGVACFTCDKLKEEPNEESLVEEASPTSTAELDDEETSFLCGIISFFCDDDEEEDEDLNTGGRYKTPGVEVEELPMGSPSIEGVESETSFMCDWFGVFCPEEATLDLSAFIACGEGTKPADDGVCQQADHNEDGEVNGEDLEGIDFSMQGPQGLLFPLDISGFDGKPGLDLTDLQPLDDCLFGNGPCDGLGVGNLPPGVFEGIPQDTLVGLGGNDFGIHMQNGSDILLGSPRDELFGGTGLPGVSDPGPIPPDFFGPGSDPFPPTQNDLFPFGSNGPGLDGPPPVVPPPTSPTTAGLPQAVQDAIARIVRDNPPGPCESLRIEVTRIRVGTTVKYRIAVTRVRDESACPDPTPQCSSDAHYQSPFPPTPEDCSAACQNGTGGCVVIETLSDGMNCIMCGPPEFEEEDPDDDEFEEDPVDDEIDLCEDTSRCDDGDECTTDDCNPENGECTHVAIPRCGIECPDFAHDSHAACERVCGSNGTCSQMPDFAGCFFCSQTDLEEIPQPGPVEEECDAPAKERSACESSCSGGTCKKSYTRDDGQGCYTCRLECTGDTQTQGECQSSCDGACAKSYTRDDGEKCYDCIAPVVVEDEGPSCPSGTTGDKSSCESQCPSDGTCIGEDGCYSCVVVNCPDGTYKDECPSSCSNGCSVVGQQHGVSCYQCKQDCGTVCSENGYGPENTDHSDSILSELNGYSCVSGANISIQTATIGECNCVGEYSLSVDTTPPECTGTPCGDVQCGGSLSCVGGPGETITVNCNWGGWEKIQKHQFRPVVGN
jgi:septal ring factor EnvC (AmiA/AmiB activator)